jgi:3,4-dihydroxy 2-butanone 4-phosphate synthase/GTP cyclohydrolase II
MAATPSPLEELKRAISPIAEIIEEAREGRMFILIDEEDRENEGDLVIPAQFATPERSTSWPATGAPDLPDADAGADGSVELDQRRAIRRGWAQRSRYPLKRAKAFRLASAHDRALTIATAIDPTKDRRDIALTCVSATARDGGTLVPGIRKSVDISRAAGSIRQL